MSKNRTEITPRDRLIVLTQDCNFGAKGTLQIQPQSSVELMVRRNICTDITDEILAQPDIDEPDPYLYLDNYPQFLKQYTVFEFWCGAKEQKKKIRKRLRREAKANAPPPKKRGRPFGSKDKKPRFRVRKENV